MDQSCVCSNHMTRLGLRHRLDTHYLAAVLNALRSTGYMGLLSTKFNNQAGINLDTLRAIVVPIRDPETQAAIGTEVRRRRDEARRLRSEAESDWDAAKLWFEDQLLGPAHR